MEDGLTETEEARTLRLRHNKKLQGRRSSQPNIDSGEEDTLVRPKHLELPTPAGIALISLDSAAVPSTSSTAKVLNQGAQLARAAGRRMSTVVFRDKRQSDPVTALALALAGEQPDPIREQMPTPVAAKLAACLKA